MSLQITDNSYLDTYEQLIKKAWYMVNKWKLFLTVAVVVFSIFQIIGLSRKDVSIPENEHAILLFLLDVEFWYFIVFMALLVIAHLYYKRNKQLQKLPFLRQFENQIRKTAMVYDLDENRLRITYGYAVKEYDWKIFQKFQFINGNIILVSDYYPISPVWLSIKKEEEQEVIAFFHVIQEKFNLKNIR